MNYYWVLVFTVMVFGMVITYFLGGQSTNRHWLSFISSEIDKNSLDAKENKLFNVKLKLTLYPLGNSKGIQVDLVKDSTEEIA